MLVQQAQGQEVVTNEDDDMPPEDSSQFRVVDLRKMVLKAVMKDGNEIFLYDKSLKYYSFSIEWIFVVLIVNILTQAEG